MPAIGWDGRDVSGLSHEQIHRWTRDGASPEALAAARDRHLARADELRTAAGRLESARRGVSATWAGRDADAAGGRTRALATQMERLAETVGGQARGIDGLRSALVRVQAAVGPPRPPALPGLGVTPVLDELRSLVTGRPADGYPGFRAAAADQAAAREAYRSYLAETATAARTVPTTGGGPAATPAPPPAPLAPGAQGAPTGVLQRAAVAGPAPAGGGPGAFPTRPAAAPGAPSAARVPTTRPAAPPASVPTRMPGPAAGPTTAPRTSRAPVPAAPDVPAPPAPGAPRPVGAPTVGVPTVRAPAAGAPTAEPLAAAPSTGPAGRPGVASIGRTAPASPSPVPDGPFVRSGATRDPARPGFGLGRPTTDPAADPDPPDEGTRRSGEEPAVPLGHPGHLVDPDPPGWGVPGGRRVAPPVFGEEPR
ncbi:hypothetical protein [Actinomycetospora atypica]|uniref:PPE family domain-containing protein n=1 Tax=Actinomycetospora atypica TaxID=1290095 RepID=A0ABV9YLK4_9PSEU